MSEREKYEPGCPWWIEERDAVAKARTVLEEAAGLTDEVRSAIAVVLHGIATRDDQLERALSMLLDIAACEELTEIEMPGTDEQSDIDDRPTSVAEMADKSVARIIHIGHTHPQE